MKVTKQPVVCLLVDRNADDQQTFIQALRDIAPGSICYIATDATEAIQILSHGQRFPDFIFLDFHTSGAYSKEFLEKVKSMNELKDVPVVIQSTHSHAEEVEELYLLGVAGIHIKEFDHNSVCKMLDQYLTDESVV